MPRIFVGIPSAEYGSIPDLVHKLSWLWVGGPEHGVSVYPWPYWLPDEKAAELVQKLKDPGAEQFLVVWCVDTKHGVIGWSRSWFLHRARLAGGFDWHVQTDTDVRWELCWWDLWNVLEDDRMNGFDVVTSPLPAAQDMIVMSKPADGVKRSAVIPYEVTEGSCGFFASSLSATMGIEPNGEYADVSAKFKIPAFCWGGKESGEDVDLYRQFRRSGFKICADPRILTLHKKNVHLPSERPNAKLRVER